MDKNKILRKLYLKCRENGIPVNPHVAAVAIRAAGDYVGIRSTYVSAIADAVLGYLRGDMGMAKSKPIFRRAMVNAFGDAFETGFMDGGGGDTYEPEPADTDWLVARTEQELGYIDLLYYSLKEIKDGATVEEPLTDADMAQIAGDRSAMYGRTLDTVYAQGKLRGKKNIMLTLEGSDGKESCSTCQRYKGQSHRAKWWVSHDLIPGPGNENYECNGFQCQHKLRDADGNIWAGNLE
jgi:hypothetical protein